MSLPAQEGQKVGNGVHTCWWRSVTGNPPAFRGCRLGLWSSVVKSLDSRARLPGFNATDQLGDPG